MSRQRSQREPPRHCGGFRLVKGDPPRIEEIHGGACHSSDGLCACPCRGCVKALATCEHANTYLSMGTLTPVLPGLRFETKPGRAKRADGTDYVGPTMTVRPRRPDEPVPEAQSWRAEVCMDCGMRVKNKL